MNKIQCQQGNTGHTWEALSAILQQMGTISQLFSACQWKVEDQQSEIRRSDLEGPDGVQLLCSLVVDSITSPYIDGSGERIPSKFDQRDYKPPHSRSFKPHLCCLQGPQYITPSVQCIYQYPSPCRCRSPKIRWKREERADQTGVSTWRGQENVKHGRQCSNDALNGRRFIMQGWQWAERGGLDGSYR